MNRDLLRQFCNDEWFAIVGSGLICHVDKFLHEIMEFETVNINCTAAFNGNLFPTVKCQRVDATGHTIELLTSSSYYENRSLFVSNAAEQVTSDMTKMKYRCSMYFNTSVFRLPLVATSNQHFEESWESHYLNVLCKLLYSYGKRWQSASFLKNT
jgi:hypothetical protein